MPRVPILHPDYVHRPLSREHRRKLSKLQRARFAPEGMRCVYGIFIPERWAEVVRKASDLYRLKHSFEDTQKFAELLFAFLTQVSRQLTSAIQRRNSRAMMTARTTTAATAATTSSSYSS